MLVSRINESSSWRRPYVLYDTAELYLSKQYTPCIRFLSSAEAARRMRQGAYASFAYPRAGYRAPFIPHVFMFYLMAACHLNNVHI